MVLDALKDADEAVQELAALALGEARIPEAFESIKQRWKRTRSAELRSSFLLAIATLRSEDSLNFLLVLLSRGNAQDAQDALMALDIYRHTTDIWQQVTKTTQLRGDSALISRINP